MILVAQCNVVGRFDSGLDPLRTLTSPDSGRHFEIKPLKTPLQNFKTYLNYERHEAHQLHCRPNLKLFTFSRKGFDICLIGEPHGAQVAC